MLELTRRPNRDPHREGWFVYCGDVEIGHIGLRAGVPKDVDQWGWHCGFQPAAQRGIAAAGTAPNFDQARNAFERAWQPMLFTEGASPAEYGAGLRYAIDRGWLWLHESGTL